MIPIQFKDRKVVIVTKHQKEKALAQPWLDSFGGEISVPRGVDTDTLGTFCGSVNRSATVLETLRSKAFLVKDVYQDALLISSEGSFGPHPIIPFAVCDEEHLFLYDTRSGFEFHTKRIFLETNFKSALIESPEKLQSFLAEIGFPSHGVIVKDAEGMLLKKEFEYDSIEELETFLRDHNSILLETDMRAHRNPTRMNNISLLVEQMLAELKRSCPSCSFPGFRVQQRVPGLPCSSCQLPTESTLKLIVVCEQCKHEEAEFFPNEKTEEDPMYCSFCNP